MVFLFCIFAKILGKFSRKYEIKITIIYNYYLIYFRENVLISSFSRNSVYLVQIIWKKTCPSMGYGGMKVWRPPPELTPSPARADGGNARRFRGEYSEQGVPETGFYPASIFSVKIM